MWNRRRARGTTIVVVAALAATAAVAAPAARAASSAPTTTTTPGGVAATSEPTWTQVTDSEGRNIDEVGVARTSDDVLHVLWRVRAGTNQEEIRSTPVDDEDVGEASVAAAGWASVGNPAVVVTDTGLRVFFPGLTGSDANADGMQSASSDDKGEVWSEQGSRVSSSTSAMPDGTGAAVRQDGTPAFAYAYSFALGLHFGLDPATPDIDLLTDAACCDYLPNLAFSEEDGDGYIAWYSNVEDQVGLWVQQIWPTTGTATAVPESALDGKAITPTQRTPLAARVGREGTYVAYCSGYPTCEKVLLWQIGEDEPVEIATGSDIEAVNLAADPDGRLWVMWEDTTENSLFAVRSNEDATEFGEIVAFSPAPDTDTVWKLQGNASSDLLDVFASFTTPDSLATWHAQVEPGLTVETKKAKKNVTFTVTDAGEPVKGAKVTLKKKTVTTNAKGQATTTFTKATATVTAPGYSTSTEAVK
jgi:hypothetical protein